MHLHAVHRDSAGTVCVDTCHTNAIVGDYSCMAYALQVILAFGIQRRGLMTRWC